MVRATESISNKSVSIFAQSEKWETQLVVAIVLLGGAAGGSRSTVFIPALIHSPKFSACWLFVPAGVPLGTF